MANGSLFGQLLKYLLAKANLLKYLILMYRKKIDILTLILGQAYV